MLKHCSPSSVDLRRRSRRQQQQQQDFSVSSSGSGDDAHSSSSGGSSSNWVANGAGVDCGSSGSDPVELSSVVLDVMEEEEEGEAMQDTTTQTAVQKVGVKLFFCCGHVVYCTQKVGRVNWDTKVCFIKVI